MLGIGVFGTGEVVKVLVSLLSEKGFITKAIWGRTTLAAETIAKELKIPFYTNKIDDVLLHKDVDLVFIVCPPYLHSEISVKALGIGKHVICDKPMGLGQLDAYKMVRASQYYPSLISLVNHSLRFLPAVTHMKRAIFDEMIGPVNDISLIDIRVQMCLKHNNFDWLCDASMGGGALNFIGSNVIDLVSFVFEKKAKRVHGVVRTYTKTTSLINGIRQITAPDFCAFQIELENGLLVTATLQTSTFATKNFVQEILVCGSKGNLIMRGSDLFVARREDDSPLKEEAIYVDIHDFTEGNISMSTPYIKGLCKMIDALKNSFTNKSTWVKEPVQAAATFEDGLYVQAVMEAIRKSNETKTWIRVEMKTESSNHDELMRFAVF